MLVEKLLPRVVAVLINVERVIIELSANQEHIFLESKLRLPDVDASAGESEWLLEPLESKPNIFPCWRQEIPDFFLVEIASPQLHLIEKAQKHL
jgi:hypothetical protein